MKYLVRILQVIVCAPIAAVVLVLAFSIMAVLLVCAMIVYIIKGKGFFGNLYDKETLTQL